MALTIGERIGPYEILAPLGQGGMGEVYRARDSRLGREVAIKILPEPFATDPDRIARFEREAKALASLNHPNIAALYGLEASDGRHALVMELVDGPTLAEVIHGLRIEDALASARQIAEALEAAHEHGIIHRDLKPANIKVRADGVVKVLDFGLAKLTEAGPGAMSGAHDVTPFGLTHSPTLSVQGTFGGVILGTAAYMSPEQARGKPVDRRTDIWAFGCVLFEMLTGRQAFDAGDTISDAVAAILKNDPDWNALPAETPSHVRTLLRRCLQKDPKKRLPHIGLVRLELDEERRDDAPKLVPALSKPWWKRAMPAAVAAIAAAFLVGGAMWMVRPNSPAAGVMRFQFALPDGQAIDDLLPSVAVSTDGTKMAYAANGRLYIRAMSEFESRPIPGAEITQGYMSGVVFSPDGQSLAFWTGLGIDSTLKRIGIAGGTPVTICQAAFPFGTRWDADGIVFGQGGPSQTNALARVSPSGGTPSTLATIEKTEIAQGPQVLPGGDALLFTLLTNASFNGDMGQQKWDAAQVVVQNLKSGSRKVLVNGGSDARYLATGHLTYLVGNTMFAVPFDVKRLEIAGASVPVVEGIGRTAFGPAVLGGSHASVSANGTLVYVPGGAVSASTLMVLASNDRSGRALAKLNVQPGRYEYPRVSPDGKHIAVGTESPTEANIWVYDRAGKSAIRQLTFSGKNRFPVWSGDSERLAFQSDREGDAAIFSQRADGVGDAERLTKPEKDAVHIPQSWSRDGRTLLFEILQGSAASLWSLSVSERKAAPFGGVTSNRVFSIGATFSPDGRRVAYSSTSGPAGGDLQAYVQPFPATGQKNLVGLGVHPLWSRDGRELFLLQPPPLDPLVSRRVTIEPTLAFSNPETVQAPGFQGLGPAAEREFDMLPDGKFVGVVDASSSPSKAGTPPERQIRIVVNWFEELKRLAPAK